MKFLRLGFVAALACALAGQALAAGPAPVKIDPKQKEQGMKEVPAVLQSAGVNCTVSDAYFMGNNEAKVGGKSVKTSIYETACGPDMGYIVIATPGGDPQIIDCLGLKADYDKKVAAKLKPGNECVLPGNVEPKVALLPLLAKGGAPCTEVTAANWLGSSPTDKVTVYEAACTNGSGYLISAPLANSTKPLTVVDCVKSATIGMACTLTTKEQAEQGIFKLSSAVPGKTACKPAKARWVVTDAANGTDYYEVGCSDGAGYMFTTDAKGGYKSIIECVRATRIADGCILSSADAGQTADADTYTKLATQIGYPCKVAKYQSYGSETGGQREIVELSCADHPEGAFAMVPTGSGQTGEYFNCVRATDRGLACRLSAMPATYALIAKQIAARGKTTCDVNGGRGIGKDSKGSDYIEVSCGNGPNLVLEYSKLPTETLVSALPCAQAPIADACKLQKK